MLLFGGLTGFRNGDSGDRIDSDEGRLVSAVVFGLVATTVGRIIGVDVFFGCFICARL